MGKIIFLALLLCAISSSFAAEVFQQTDSNGNVVYSDMPLNPDAKKITIDSQYKTNKEAVGGVARTSEPVTQTGSANAFVLQSAAPLNKTHTVFLINSPKDQETIYNQPIITINIKIEPQLDEGEKIQLLFDGAPKGPPVAATQFALENVDRGTHQLAAALIDKNNQVIKETDTITIYVHHTSINNIITSPAR
ncbi:MAG: DUF4124 domain-containing protein [Gammaproteobacteria bacterium]